VEAYTMNDHVYFKLTEKGKKIWEEDNRRMKKRVPSINWQIRYYHGEWIREPLWYVFKKFGKYIEAGADTCIFDITFKKPMEVKDE